MMEKVSTSGGIMIWFKIGLLAIFLWCLFSGVIGYGRSRLKWKEKRLEIARRNMLNHCATKEDFRILIEGV